MMMFSLHGTPMLVAEDCPGEFCAITCAGNLAPVPRGFPGAGWFDAYPTREAARLARRRKVEEGLRLGLRLCREAGQENWCTPAEDYEAALRVMRSGIVVNPEDTEIVGRCR